MRGVQDPTPPNIASDPMIVDLRSRVGSIKENNIRREVQQAETMRAVAEHGKILTEQARILANHNKRVVFQDQMLSDQKEILKQLCQI